MFADTEKMRVKITWRVSEPFAGIHMKMNLHARDSTPVGITHPVDLAPPSPGKIYTSVFEFDRVCWARDSISSISTFLTARWPTRSAWTSP